MDRHLNIFEFFNGSDKEHLEDNLSRAFALCLKNDNLLLDKTLRAVLSEEIYSSIFDIEERDSNFEIDLQKSSANFGSYAHVVAVACSGNEVDMEQIQYVDARDTNVPVTDLSIVTKDLCIIFEFKRTGEDCSSQLKRQAESITQEEKETNVSFVDYNWKKIVQTVLQTLFIEKQNSSVNQFTQDFKRLIEKKYPYWFPQKTLSQIPYPKDGDKSNWHYLHSRLNILKRELYDEDQLKELKGTFNRLAISVDWGWAHEVNIYPRTKGDEEFISIDFHAGDTKAQGAYLYNKIEEAIDWPSRFGDYVISVSPYIKFSHFNTGVYWYHPTPEEYRKTHTKSFFHNVAGRKKKKSWGWVEGVLSDIAPKWREDGKYDEAFIASHRNRNYYDISMGNHLMLLIPYKRVRELDVDESNSSFSVELGRLIKEFRNLVDGLAKR